MHPHPICAVNTINTGLSKQCQIQLGIRNQRETIPQLRTSQIRAQVRRNRCFEQKPCHRALISRHNIILHRFLSPSLAFSSTRSTELRNLSQHHNKMRTAHKTWPSKMRTACKTWPCKMRNACKTCPCKMRTAYKIWPLHVIQAKSSFTHECDRHSPSVTNAAAVTLVWWLSTSPKLVDAPLCRCDAEMPC